MYVANFEEAIYVLHCPDEDSDDQQARQGYAAVRYRTVVNVKEKK